VEDRRYVPAIITADLIELGNEPQPVAAVTDTAINTRPEVELQYTTLLAGQAKVDLAKNRPILQGYGNAQFQAPAVTGGNANAEYGVQLLWNVYTGGKDRLERKQAETELKSLSEGVLDLEAKIELDATTSWNRAFAARASVASAKKTLDLSSEALRAASVGYGAGVTPYIDFQNALDNNVAAALGYLMSLVEVKLSQVNLERAEGFPAGYPGDSRAGRDSGRKVQELVTGSTMPAPTVPSEPTVSANTAAPAGE
jgi:outer membrane protein TolC